MVTAHKCHLSTVHWLRIAELSGKDGGSGQALSTAHHHEYYSQPTTSLLNLGRNGKPDPIHCKVGLPENSSH